jgi:hypothetical protein
MDVDRKSIKILRLGYHLLRVEVDSPEMKSGLIIYRFGSQGGGVPWRALADLAFQKWTSIEEAAERSCRHRDLRLSATPLSRS